ncbi:hypothetical protein MMC15_005941 [Xylographa vitiligo]|nr:hypothetical protein [Xylographa vitiligo]
MVLCSWSILCMNIPGPQESKYQVLWRKLSLTALGVLCPEVIFSIAIGQWVSARHSVRDFKTAGLRIGPGVAGDTMEEWSMKEAFFADMGGFILHTKDQSPFPLDAEQLHYLVSRRHVKLPDLTNRMVEDKNKVDGLLRALTLWQTTWFIVNVIGRWAQHLVVTTAELTTVSFILCSTGTAFCWWHKPAGVATAEIIDSDISINDILQAEGLDHNQWKRTPLDFVNRREWWWSRCWSNFVNILRNMHLSFGSETVPIDRIDDSLQREPPKRSVYICMALTYAFFSVLFVAWNDSFPTHIEQTLWRAACITMMATLFALMICAELAWTYPVLQQRFRLYFASKSFMLKSSRSDSHRQRSNSGGSVRKKWENALDCVRNNSVGKDPLFYIPLKVIIPIYIIAVFYCHARTYILIADILELRSLPASAYATVEWPNLLPHIG